MPNVGMSELLLIVVVGLLVFGPTKLPDIMRNVGKAVRVFQTEMNKATTALREGVEDPAPVSSVSREIRQHEDT
jgi:sec-independent protein translocase protein TatA